jgi:NADH-quinone oxidoreductase subunit L
MVEAVWLLPAFPLAGFFILVVFGRKLGEPRAGYLATAMVGLSFVAAIGVFADLLSRPSEERSQVVDLFTWISAGRLEVKMGFLVDPLSITMALFVTGVGALIHLYSIGYMHGDPKFSKFFIYLNLFVFSMLMLVLGENLVVTFLGWEGVGTCSYLLVSFWFTRNTAAVAGKKAFVTNRVGDLGFMLGMFLTFQAVGTLSYTGVLPLAGGLAGSTATAIALLLFLGAVGKSAQLPLYIWLPDAMEGPTPVSALIHAATMVTAGVYLMVRINPILFRSDSALWVIAIVGALTALFAATIAVAQTDIKKVLAYSTISQLGYMFLAVGSEAYVAAIFHMITHAFFKALLFLGAGSVIHGMNNDQDMRHMGALRKVMPITSFCFIIGWLAISGVPPLSGFWSKDEILANAWDKSPVLWFIGVFTALLTAYYMTRQVIMVFYGKERWEEARPTYDDTEVVPPATPVPQSVGAAVADDAQELADHGGGHGAGHGSGQGAHPHESPWLMTFPLIVLAIGAAFGGVLNLPFGDLDFLHRWLESVPFLEITEHENTASTALELTLVLVSVTFVGIGIFLAYTVYARHRLRAIEPNAALHGWHVDDAVSWAVEHPGMESWEGVAEFDHNVVDGTVMGAGALTKSVGSGLRRYQSGLIRLYALGIGLGAVLLLGWFLLAGVL